LCHPITKEMYTSSNQLFIHQLKRLLNSYTSESIFGHSISKEHKAPEATPKVQQITREVPASTPAASSPSPTYAQVTQLGGQGYQGRPAPKDRKHVPPGHQSIAPTGLVRTWGWYTVTNPADKVKHPIRIPVMMHHQKNAPTPSVSTMVIGWMYKVYVHTVYQTNT
jgi:hypothetical protein